MKLFLLALGVTGLLSTELAAREFICAKSPKVNGRCYWSRGMFNASNGEGDALTLAEAGYKVNLNAPDKLYAMLGDPADGVYIVADFLFCPMSYESRRPDEYSYGCIEAFKNAVKVPYYPTDNNETFYERVCKKLDCSKAGFSKFLPKSK